MKTFKQSYPRRAEMLRTPFVPLSDDDFRRLVANGSAIPSQLGAVLFVSKWRDGPGIGAEPFLAALKTQGAKLMARTYGSDVNIRVVPDAPPAAGGERPPARTSKSGSR